MTTLNAALDIARTGLDAVEKRMGTIAQNISSDAVRGYKKIRTVEVDMPYTYRDLVGTLTSDAGTIAPNGLPIGHGVMVAGITRIFTQGDPVETGNALDMSILGEGFFEVALPDGGRAFTRAGAFQVGPGNTLVSTITGYPLVPQITIPADALGVKINADGRVYVEQPGNLEPQEIGQIQLTTFLNPAGLKAIGYNMFLPTPASLEADTGAPGTARRGTIMQGNLESSNVDTIEEVVLLMKSQRQYEQLTKVLQAGDSMAKTANSIGSAA